MVTARKVIPIKKVIKAWSYSRINDHKKCPKLADFKFIQKLKEPGSPAMDRGSAIHSIAQRFSRANAKARLPKELEYFEEEFRQVQQIKTALTEQQWAFDKHWNRVDWFSEEAWCRVVVDLAFAGKAHPKKFYVVDYKTGKLNPSHLGQLSLYALAALLLYPEMEEVEVQLWYLDWGVIWPDDGTECTDQFKKHPGVFKMSYTQDDVRALKLHWDKESKPILSDRSFQPKPSSSCGWCHFSKAKGGPCRY